MTSAPLYDVSTRLIDLLPGRFLKIEPHDAADPESCDFLWIKVDSDESEMSEGEVITVSPLGAERWYGAHDGALKFGGWPTYWDKAGTADEVVHAVTSYLTGLGK